MRKLIAIALLTMLGGCWWTGPRFYRPDPAAPAPLSAGNWTVTQTDGETKTVRIERYRDGSFGSPTDEPRGSRLSLTPLPVKGRNLWVVQLTSVSAKKDEAVYGLAERRGDMLDLLPIIDCEGNEDLVREAGGSVRVAEKGLPDVKVDEGNAIDPQSIGTTCLFADAATLERALTAYAALHPRLAESAHMKRAGD